MQEKPRELRTLALRRYHGNCGIRNRPEKFRKVKERLIAGYCLVVRPAKFANEDASKRPQLRNTFDSFDSFEGLDKTCKNQGFYAVNFMCSRGNIVNIQAVPTDEATRKSVHEFCRNSLVECENQFSLTE